MKKADRIAAHNKWLESMGVKTSKPKKPRKGIYDIPDYKTNAKVKTSDSIGNGTKKKEHTYTGSQDICVGLLYNKGNYGVLSKTEAKDPATGKRRC